MKQINDIQSQVNKLLNNNNKLVNTIIQLKEENAELKKEKSTQTNSNINLVPFGEEIIDDEISREVLSNCMHRGAMGDAELFRRIHFDSSLPEWQNVKPRDIARKKYSVWSGDKSQGGVGWCVRNEDFVFGIWPTQLANIYLDNYLKKLSDDELSKMSNNEKTFLNRRKDELIYKSESHITELTNEMRNVMKSTKIKFNST